MKKLTQRQREELADVMFYVPGIFALALTMMACISITVQFVAGDYYSRLNIAFLFWTTVLFGVSYWGWKNKA